MVCAVICGLVVKVDDAKVKLVFAIEEKGKGQSAPSLLSPGQRKFS